VHATITQPCKGCRLPVLLRCPHQICEGLACHTLVWCMNCIPHTNYRGVAAVLRGEGCP
jgi:hypothetical protein